MTEEKLMTEEKFLSTLGCINIEWVETGMGGLAIRHQDPTTKLIFCPVTFIAFIITGKHWRFGRYNDAATAVHLPLLIAQRIANAADKICNYDKDLRRKLLAACKLGES